MIKRIMAAAVGLTLLLAGAALAQTEDQCNQVRAAVAHRLKYIAHRLNDSDRG